MNGRLAFDLMRHSFVNAASTCASGVSELCYILAGQLVLFRVAGCRLAERLDEPFRHLQANGIADDTPRLIIELWDENETGIPCDDACMHPVRKDSFNSEIVAYRFQHTVVYFDRGNGHMIACVSNAEELSLYERGRPLHPPLAQWLNDQKAPLIHAGLISKDRKGVLLAGTTGSGKSTIAVTCAKAAFRYLSDDLVGLEVLSLRGIAGHSVYNSTYLEADHLDRFPELKPYAINDTGRAQSKVLVLLSQVRSARLDRSVDINVIALPRICSGSKSIFSPAPKSKALFALVPSSRKINKHLGMTDFDKIVKLVEQLPSYWINVGHDLNNIPECIEKLLEEVS